jgi:hypothetical protein
MGIGRDALLVFEGFDGTSWDGMGVGGMCDDRLIPMYEMFRRTTYIEIELMASSFQPLRSI